MTNFARLSSSTVTVQQKDYFSLCLVGSALDSASNRCFSVQCPIGEIFIQKHCMKYVTFRTHETTKWTLMVPGFANGKYWGSNYLNVTTALGEALYSVVAEFHPIKFFPTTL